MIEGIPTGKSINNKKSSSSFHRMMIVKENKQYEVRVHSNQPGDFTVADK